MAKSAEITENKWVKNGIHCQKQQCDKLCTETGKKRARKMLLVSIIHLCESSRIRAYDWYKNQWPWMTLNGVMTADARAISAGAKLLVSLVSLVFTYSIHYDIICLI